ncbi:MAG TPA: hypothetical protein VFU89_02140 [Rhabdochlamydiaceae bacterium]|nr:hypothetical protein [Rhabdochlamydiaceae bacterium]
MRKMLKFFLLFFMIVFVSLAASETVENEIQLRCKEKYRLTVTEIDPEHQCFKLSNQLICNIPKKNWGMDSLPAVGDEIALVPIRRIYNRGLTHVEQGELRVHNRSSNGGQDIDVWISSESEYPLFISRQESVCIAEGWFSNTDEEVFTLTDGSSWIKNSKVRSLFSEGDRIIVSCYQGNKYLLINLDKNFQSNIREKKQLRQLTYQIVEPFSSKKNE